jgi:hypothetical protein
MSFSDWEFFSSGGIVAPSIEMSSTIEGSGSLLVDVSGSGAKQVVAQITDASGIPHGFLRGKIRTLIVVDSFTSGHRIGLGCLFSQDNITTGGSSYSLLVRNRPGDGVTFRIGLYKALSGIESGISLVETGDQALSLSQVFAIELAWNADIIHGFTNLIGRFGLSADFSDLSDVIEYQDMNIPLQYTVNEGIVARFIASGDEVAVWRMDKTITFERVVI